VKKLINSYAIIDPALYWLNTPYADVYLFDGVETSPNLRKPRRCCTSACYNEPILFDPENLGYCTAHLSEEAIALRNR
jgi:hypothetical protein